MPMGTSEEANRTAARRQMTMPTITATQRVTYCGWNAGRARTSPGLPSGDLPTCDRPARPPGSPLMSIAGVLAAGRRTGALVGGEAVLVLEPAGSDSRMEGHTPPRRALREMDLRGSRSTAGAVGVAATEVRSAALEDGVRMAN
eukprot:1159337-Prymnesium_polylepis.2